MQEISYEDRAKVSSVKKDPLYKFMFVYPPEDVAVQVEPRVQRTTCSTVPVAFFPLNFFVHSL